MEKLLVVNKIFAHINIFNVKVDLHLSVYRQEREGKGETGQNHFHLNERPREN